MLTPPRKFLFFKKKPKFGSFGVTKKFFCLCVREFGNCKVFIETPCFFKKKPFFSSHSFFFSNCSFDYNPSKYSDFNTKLRYNPIGKIESHFFTKTRLIIDHLKKKKQTMSVYNHRPMVPAPQSRVIEMLDSIRGEFDQLAQELYVCKSQRDDFEHKSKKVYPLVPFGA